MMLIQAASEVARIPAEPPIGGPVWTVVVPALLLLFTAVATAMLYRKFAGK
jgi:hypothetical protein